MYAFSVPNAYIVASNLPGALAAMAYTVLALPLMPREAHAERRIVQLVMVAGVAAISAIWCLLTFADIDAPHRSFYLGAFASALCVIMFASPLSTLKRVLARPFACLRALPRPLPPCPPCGASASPETCKQHCRSGRCEGRVAGCTPPQRTHNCSHHSSPPLYTPCRFSPQPTPPLFTHRSR